MFDLKCQRMSCKYNKDCSCQAKNVQVGASTTCETYEDTGYKATKTDQIKQTPTRKNTCVKCEAKCLFNDQTTCKANSISVMTNDFSPRCCTFMPK